MSTLWRTALLLLLPFCTFLVAAEPIKVFVLAGQSNMEGKAKVSLLEQQIRAPETAELFRHLHDDGKWVVRDDVWIKFLDRKGKLTVGFGSPGRIGPELEFGHIVGDRFEEPVLIIKTAWGGKSLFKDFRPPSAGAPPVAHLKRDLEQRRRKEPAITLDAVKERYGFYYRAMLEEVTGTLKNLKEHFPDYPGQGYELAGFVWFQGWNDMVNDEYTAAYTDNMVHFIRDVRRDLGAPRLPFVIGVLGVGGTKEQKPNPKRDAFKKAQAAAGAHPDFKGNVRVVHTDQYWDMTAAAVFEKGWKDNVEAWERVGSDYPYHYLGSAKTMVLIGRGFAEAVLELSRR